MSFCIHSYSFMSENPSNVMKKFGIILTRISLYHNNHLVDLGSVCFFFFSTTKWFQHFNYFEEIIWNWYLFSSFFYIEFSCLDITPFTFFVVNSLSVMGKKYPLWNKIDKMCGCLPNIKSYLPVKGNIDFDICLKTQFFINFGCNRKIGIPRSYIGCRSSWSDVR